MERGTAGVFEHAFDAGKHPADLCATETYLAFGGEAIAEEHCARDLGAVALDALDMGALQNEAAEAGVVADQLARDAAPPQRERTSGAGAFQVDVPINEAAAKLDALFMHRRIAVAAEEEEAQEGAANAGFLARLVRERIADLASLTP